ncbi:Acetyltransferase (GNAT) family protein [Devosia crocina]|uniref:Acetyltransferase (GNAT) family protein n=1 Tax=Devosia crocina TaxID=429728 RepID=A0A1I7NT93_9HYPH|nr:GNAT family N-acetyltransferase [Devosia crocina]SFV37897.1 Acetyltransferase (GNAT) family protein [Devosia crocina]
MMRFKDVHWRAMTGYDAEAVFAIAQKVHPGFFESAEVLAEKHALYRNGCYMLEIGEKPAGYVLSHPFLRGSLPALDTLLGALPENPDTFYIHDLALLGLARGVGAAGKIVSALTKHAEVMGFPTMSLVAVNGSKAFWEKQGFVVEDHPELADKLAGYEDEARYMVKRV